MTEHTALVRAMILHETNCPHRVHHFLKVHTFARLIALEEGLDAATASILEVAALVHDIGIKASLEKYGSSKGSLQEQEGRELAGPLLRRLGYPEAVVERVCYLVSRHHTFTDIDGPDYQILVEADFLVNIHEGSYTREAAGRIFDTVFKTTTGRELFQTLYGGLGAEQAARNDVPR